VASVITLVVNINNNITGNNKNNNQANLSLSNSNNLITNLNQNVCNNFNLMFPPGKRRRRGARGEVGQELRDSEMEELRRLHLPSHCRPSLPLHTNNTADWVTLQALLALQELYY